MSRYVIDCEDIDESSLVGSSIRKVVDWAVNGALAGERALVIIGESGSGKTTALILIMKRLRRLGLPVAYINAYNEMGLGRLDLVGCNNDENARVLLVDDIDAVLTTPRMANGLVNKVLSFRGTVIASLTVPLVVGNDLELVEPLVKLLHSASRMSIEYRYEDLRVFAQRIGVGSIEPGVRTPGMVLRNFRRGRGSGARLDEVLSGGDVVL